MTTLTTNQKKTMVAGLLAGAGFESTGNYSLFRMKVNHQSVEEAVFHLVDDQLIMELVCLLDMDDDEIPQRDFYDESALRLIQETKFNWGPDMETLNEPEDFHGVSFSLDISKCDLKDIMTAIKIVKRGGVKLNGARGSR